MRSSPFIVLLLLSSCSEWGFRRDRDLSDSDTDPDVFLPTCEAELSALDVATTECRIEPGPLEAKVQWRQKAWWKGAPNVVIPTIDSNEDGTIDALDETTLLMLSSGKYEFLDPRTGTRQHSEVSLVSSASRVQSPVWLNGRLQSLSTYDDGPRGKGFEIHDALTGEWLYRTSPEDRLNANEAQGRRRWAHLGADVGVRVTSGAAILTPELKLVGWGSAGVGLSREGAGYWHSLGADLDGDGIGEVVTGNTIYRPSAAVDCIRNSEDGEPSLVDLDSDGRAEVLRYRVVYSNERWQYTLDAMNSTCEQVARFEHESFPDMMFGPPGVIGPALGRDELGILTQGRWPDPDTGEMLDGAVVFNRQLEVVRRIPDFYLHFAADLDGDGTIELVGSYLNRNQTRVIDARTGDVLLRLAGYPHGALDFDGDGHTEILTFDRETNELILYEGTGNGWARGLRSMDLRWLYYPALRTPSGGLAPPPHDWKRLNLLNASIDDGWRLGVGSDPSVTIEDVCSDECDRDRAVAWVRVANRGAVDVEQPLLARLWGERDGQQVLLDQVAVPSLASGRTTEGLRLVVEDASTVRNLWADVVADGWVLLDQCDDSNDRDEWAGGLCR